MADKEPLNVMCPTPESLLAHLMRHKKVRRPEMFPSEPFEAARFWMTLMEPPNDHTEPVEKILKDGAVVGWKTPYHDRLVRCLRRFLALKHLHQLYVYENVKRGIAYRGDDFWFYQMIVDNHDRRMKAIAEGKQEAFETEAFTDMRQAVKDKQMPDGLSNETE